MVCLILKYVKNLSLFLVLIDMNVNFFAGWLADRLLTESQAKDNLINKSNNNIKIKSEIKIEYEFSKKNSYDEFRS